MRGVLRLLVAGNYIEPHAHAGAREGQGEERDEEPVALQPQRGGALAARRALRARRPQFCGASHVNALLGLTALRPAAGVRYQRNLARDQRAAVAVA